MWQTGYPLHVMHGYVMPAREAFDFSSLVHRVDPETLSRIEVVTDARRPLLAYAALVLENVVRIARPKEVVISALGVREGLLYSMLDPTDGARVLGVSLRVASLISASATGVLPTTPMVVEHGRLVLRFDKGFKALAGERVFARLRQLARLIGREPVMETR